MKNFYTLLFALLLAFSTSNVLAQAGPCTLSGASNYIDFTSSSTIMMHISVNGISQYTYGWNDGTPVGSSSQKPFYSGWCVTITDIMTGCDTTICESCIPTGGVGMCTMIYAPVCGCDGNIYSNDCVAMYNGIFTYTSAIGPNGQLLPCVPPVSSWDCTAGVCVDPGTGLGQYSTLNDCVLDSCSVMPPAASWDCTAGGCVDPGTGLGQYATQTNCQSMCIPVAPSWDCINGACIDPGTGLGTYISLGLCNSVCAITLSWDCVNGTCVDPGTGLGAYNSLGVCIGVCAITPSWDCVGNACVDPGTGAGMYASQAACANVCLVSGVEEQTTSKKLLKITDLLGRETKGSKNDVLFYIYDDGTVEKRIVIE